MYWAAVVCGFRMYGRQERRKEERSEVRWLG